MTLGRRYVVLGLVLAAGLAVFTVVAEWLLVF